MDDDHHNIKDGAPGKIPKEISLLPHLRSLVVQRGTIIHIPKSIFDIQSLQNLDLDKNRLKGPFPVPVGNSTTNTEMLRLDLNFNNLSGSLDFLSYFPNLKEAHLDNNSFEGKIPAAIGDLSNLREYFRLFSFNVNV